MKRELKKRELNIKDWSGYIFTNMANINDFDHEFLLVNDFKSSKDGSILFNVNYCEENHVPHIVFNNIECIFRKNGVFSYLIFCESDKNKRILDDHVKVIDGIKEEVLPFIDEFKDDLFIMSKDFIRFKFKTDDNLVYDKKLNVPVCVISISGVVKKGHWYYPQIKLQKCFFENDYLDKQCVN